MKPLTCEMCGSTNLLKQDGVFVCQSCGTKYSVEEAKKMMVEGTVDIKGTVKIDKTSDLNNLINLCETALNSSNNEEALSYANKILEIDSSLYNGWFLKMQAVSGLATLLDLRCNEIISLGQSAIANAKNEEEKIAVYDYWLFSFAGLMNFCINQLYDPARQQNCLQVYFAQKEAFGKSYAQADCITNDELLNLVINQLPLLLDLRLAIPNDVISKNEQLIKGVQTVSSTWKFLQQAINSNYNNYETGMPQELLDLFRSAYSDIIKGIPESAKIEVQNADLQNGNDMNNESHSHGACYVATAVYGSYDCPEVWTLRRFRDLTLAETWYGRLFIKIYYAISPTLVRWFGKTEWFKSMWRRPLNKLVKCLQNRGVRNTPYNDRKI